MAPTPETKKKGGFFSRKKDTPTPAIHIDKNSIKPVTVPSSTLLSPAHQSAYPSIHSPTIASAGLSAWPTSPQAPSPSDSQGNFNAYEQSTASVSQIPWNDVSAHLASSQEIRRSGSSSPIPSQHKSSSSSDLRSTSMTSSPSAQSAQSVSGATVAANGYVMEEGTEPDGGEDKRGGLGRLFGKRKSMQPPNRTVSNPGSVAPERQSLDGSLQGGRGPRSVHSVDNQSSYGLSIKSPTPSIAPSKLRTIPDTPAQASFDAQAASRPSPPARQPSHTSVLSSSNKSTKSSTARKHQSVDGLSSVSGGTSVNSLGKSFNAPPSLHQASLATISAGKAVFSSAPIRLRVFIDHPTTDPLYITANPGTETIRSLKHKILKTDNDRFVQFRQQRRSPVEQRWDITDHPMDEPSNTTFNIDTRVTLFAASVDWLTVSQTKRSFEKTRTFKSIVSSQPSIPMLAPPTEPLDLVSLFADTKEAAAARLKGVIEILVRVAPEGTVPVLVSFSDLPDQPVIVDIGDEMTIGRVKASIGEARKLVYRSVSGGSTKLDPADFFLFKASHPRFSESPLPFDIDHFEGLAPGMLFDDEDEKFGNHPFIIESGLTDPKVWIKRVELVAFLVSDMEEDFRDSLKMKHVSHENYSDPSNYDLSAGSLTRHPNGSGSTLTTSSQPSQQNSSGSSNRQHDSNHNRSRTISHTTSRSQPRSYESEQSRSRTTSQPSRSGPPSSVGSNRPSAPSSPRKADIRSVSSPVSRSKVLHTPLAEFPSTSSGGYMAYEPQERTTTTTSKRDKYTSIQPPPRQPSSPYGNSMAGSTSAPNLDQMLLGKTSDKRAPFVNPSYAYSPHEVSPSSSPRQGPLVVDESEEEDLGPLSKPAEQLAPSSHGQTFAAEVRPSAYTSTSASPPRMTPELSNQGSLGMDDILRGYGNQTGSLGLSNVAGGQLKQLEVSRGAVFLDENATAKVQDVVEYAQVVEPVAAQRYKPSSPGEISPLASVKSLDTSRGTYSGPSHNFRYTDDVSPTSQPMSLPPVEDEQPDTRASIASAYSAASYDSSLPEKDTRNGSHASDHTVVQNAARQEQETHQEEQEEDFVDVEEDEEERQGRGSDSSSLRAERDPPSPAAAPGSAPAPAPSTQEEEVPQSRSTRFASTVDENNNQRISQQTAQRNPNQRQHPVGSIYRRASFYKNNPPVRSALKGGRKQVPSLRDDDGGSTPPSAFARVHPVNTKVGNRISRDMSLYGRSALRRLSSNASLDQRKRLSHVSIYQGVLRSAQPSPLSATSRQGRQATLDEEPSRTIRQLSLESRSQGSQDSASLRRSISQERAATSFSSSSTGGRDYPPISPVLSPPPSDSDLRRRHSSRAALAEVEEEEPAKNVTEGYTLIGGAMFKVMLMPMDAKGEKVMQTERFKKSGPLYSITSMEGSFSS